MVADAGEKRHPKAKRLMITADGKSNFKH